MIWTLRKITLTMRCWPGLYEQDATQAGFEPGEIVVGEAKIITKMNHSGNVPENIASITGKDLDEINAILEGKVPVIL